MHKNLLLSSLCTVAILVGQPCWAASCTAQIGTPEIDVWTSCGPPNKKIIRYGKTYWYYDNVILETGFPPQQPQTIVLQLLPTSVNPN